MNINDTLCLSVNVQLIVQLIKIIHNSVHVLLFLVCHVKDARSVSLYQYNRSQNLISYMLNLLNKLTLQRKLQNFVTNNAF